MEGCMSKVFSGWQNGWWGLCRLDCWLCAQHKQVLQWPGDDDLVCTWISYQVLVLWNIKTQLPLQYLISIKGVDRVRMEYQRVIRVNPRKSVYERVTRVGQQSRYQNEWLELVKWSRYKGKNIVDSLSRGRSNLNSLCSLCILCCFLLPLSLHLYKGTRINLRLSFLDVILNNFSGEIIKGRMKLKIFNAIVKALITNSLTIGSTVPVVEQVVMFSFILC
jgi:hypothetical protein